MQYYDVVEEGGWEYHVRKRKKGRFAPDQRKQQLHVRIGEKLRAQMKAICYERRITMSDYAAMSIAQQVQRDEGKIREQLAARGQSFEDWKDGRW